MLLRLLLLLPCVLWGGPLSQGSSYRLELQESVTVQESLCVFVLCKFSYSRTLSGTIHQFWFKKEVNINRNLPVATSKPDQNLQERTQGRFFLSRDLKSNNCSLTIRDVNTRDSGTYFFRVESRYHRYTYDKMLTLNVTGLTHTPSILIPGILESGRPSNLTCSVPWACEWGTPPIFFWTSAAHTSLGPQTQLSSVITLTPRPQDHGTNLTCQVHFPAAGVTVERTVQLNVTSLKILQTTTFPILEGEAVRLLCEADSNPPAELSWFRGSPALNATPISSTATLELPRVGTAEEGEFSCRVRHPLGSQTLSLSLSVLCKQEPKAGGVLGVVGEAVTMVLALLSLCLCLIFRVKTCREKAAQPVQSMDNDGSPEVGSASGVYLHWFQTDSPSSPPDPGGASLIAEDKQELHYASLRFHNLKLQEQKDVNTEYSEIKTHSEEISSHHSGDWKSECRQT
ncbi:LOW QUALITY PROTEIN: sialic acid-binding Ig-like lectin 6 [Saccopteryx bilineata]|uniref:LOW QUALITY PROTEIN: sialic acid-binding Ig-like lectin 6 n=1 Tax=Saccopteryx bilineata TaxID=59482 RepID=UPI00338E36F9